MAKPTSEPDTTIEGLLQQRAQYEQWLARLDSAGDKAPPAVRERVRSDYDARLKGVIEQLRSHSTTISEELERHRKTQSGLDHEKRTVEEELSEAEVRHAVGEYSEDEWNRLAQESNDRLTRLRGELSGVGHEIARLAEVQGLISGTPKRAEPPPAPPAPPPAPPPAAVVREPEPVHMAEPTPPPAARQAPRAPAREPEITHGTPAADELAFLKSVAPDEDKKPAPAQAAAPSPAPSRRSNPGAGTAGRSGEAATTQAAPAKPGAAGVAKTLKCGECGTLNRPTEWYCERCGAELAGI
jgi:outer membrane biosynthesis protein TonB